ncbi:hypothetical protein [Pelagivirga sediminicola]|uniref:hypothetical protein n=1 Tax=Pelagivirga sediminicola TaxID=2170575 RepID=UPI001A9C37C7|nr:hypothetical protein [Pelagivirga sediminicola]
MLTDFVIFVRAPPTYQLDNGSHAGSCLDCQEEAQALARPEWLTEIDDTAVIPEGYGT